MDDKDLRDAIAGDQRALRVFVQEYGPLLRAMIRQMVVGAWLEREEDLLQELLLALFADGARVLRKWDPTKGRSLKSFIWLFGRHRTIDWLRRQRRTQREQPMEDRALTQKVHDATEDEPEAPYWLDPLLNAFRSEFSKEDQRLVEMLFLEERSVREVATTLEMSEDAVYQRRHRIKVRLLEMKRKLSEQTGRGT